MGATISGLAAGTTYHYRLVAISADGTTAGADAAFTTTGDAASPGAAAPADLAHDGRRDHLEQRAARRRDQPAREEHDVVVRVRAERRLRVRVDPPEHERARRTPGERAARRPRRLDDLPLSPRAAERDAASTSAPTRPSRRRRSCARAPSGLTLSASARTQPRTVSISASGTLDELARPAHATASSRWRSCAAPRSSRCAASRSALTAPIRERVSLRRSATGHRVSVLAHFTGNATLLPQPARRVLVSIG